MTTLANLPHEQRRDRGEGLKLETHARARGRKHDQGGPSAIHECAPSWLCVVVARLGAVYAIPPSTTMVCPVTSAAPAQRKKITSAMSSGWQIRRNIALLA